MHSGQQSFNFCSLRERHCQDPFSRSNVNVYFKNSDQLVSFCANHRSCLTFKGKTTNTLLSRIFAVPNTLLNTFPMAPRLTGHCPEDKRIINLQLEIKSIKGLCSESNVNVKDMSCPEKFKSNANITILLKNSDV